MKQQSAAVNNVDAAPGNPAMWPGSSFVVAIPAYRPLPQIVAGIEQLSRAGCQTIIVIDDGSGSDYAELFKQAQCIPGVIILVHNENRGKGAALKTAFRYAMQHCPDLAGVVTMDADGQHLASDVVAVANSFAISPNALVLGVRRLGDGVPWRSRFGNGLTRAIFQLVARRRVSDTQTGLRAIPAEFLNHLFSISADRYDFELEMLLMTRPVGIEILEREIETIYFDKNASSHFNPVIDSLLIYYSLFRFTLSALAAVFADFIGFTAALSTGFGIPGALAIGRILGIVVNFTLNRNFVFHHRHRLAFTLSKYLALVVVLAMVSYGLIVLFVGGLGFHVLIAKIVAESLLFGISYLVQSTLVFARGDTKSKRVD